MPASANDINVRRHVAGLLRLEESVDDFIDWFQSAYWQIDRHAIDDDYDLAMSVDNLLWELTGGYVDEDEFREELRKDAEEFGIAWQPVAQLVGEPRLAS